MEKKFSETLTRKGGHGAGSDRLGRLLNLHQTHTAVTGNGEAAVVAESRNVDAGDLAGLEHSHALGDLNGVAIDEDLDGVIGVGEMNSSAGERGPGWEIWWGIGLGRGSFWVVELGRGGDGSGNGRLVNQNPGGSVENGRSESSRSNQS